LTKTLREGAAETILDAIDDWPTIQTENFAGLNALAVLDRLLDYLEAHADEWRRQAGAAWIINDYEDDIGMTPLIGVLRGPDR